jgi:hypothetical protein
MSPIKVAMMGVTTPFRTQTYRTTSESQSNSFIKSSQNSSFSAATTVSSDSSSSSAKYTGLGFGGKGSGSDASNSQNDFKTSFANDKTHGEENTKNTSQAIVSQFTYMPMKTFSLREGGLMLSDYAYFRLRK